METPQPRMTRSRARGLATPLTSAPAARKTPGNTTRASSRTATKAKRQTEPSDDVMPGGAPPADQEQSEAQETGQEDFDSYDMRRSNDLTLSDAAAETEQRMPEPASEDAAAALSPEVSEVDLAPLMGAMQLEGTSMQAEQPDVTYELTAEQAEVEEQEAGYVIPSAGEPAAEEPAAEEPAAEEPVADLPATVEAEEGMAPAAFTFEEGEEAIEYAPEATEYAPEAMMGMDDADEQQDDDQELPVEEQEDSPESWPVTAAAPAEFRLVAEEAPEETAAEEDSPEAITLASPIEVTPEPAVDDVKEEVEQVEEENLLIAAAPAACDSQMASPPASPVPTIPASKYLSKTPGPAASARTPVTAKAPLTAVKASAPTPLFSRPAGRVSAAPTPTAAAPAAGHSVRFMTPAKTAATPGKASTATLKAALKPSSTFGTPGAATQKTSDGAASTRSVKRVSISTPVHPKSASAPRQIVRTPFPRSSERKGLLEEDDLAMEVGCAMEGENNAAILLETAGASTPAASDEVQENNADMADDGVASQDVDDLPLDQQQGSQDDDEDMMAAADAFDNAGLQALASPSFAPTPSSEPLSSMASKSTTPAAAVVASGIASKSSSTKRVQAHAALKSLAKAETYAGQATRSGCTPGSTSGAGAVPSYMAPTTAALRKSKVAGPALKSVAIPSEEYDNCSMGQVRRQIKEAAARKAGAAPTQPAVKMSEMRKPRLVEKATRHDSPEPREAPEDDEAVHDPAAEALLTAAMNKLEIAKPKGKIAPLKGMPVPQGKHVRFGSKGKPHESPSNTRPVLRGVAPAAGSHLRFAD